MIDFSKPIAFRLPGDVPQPVLDHLSKIKEQKGKGFSSWVSSKIINSVSEEIYSIGEKVVINLPGSITKEQRDWLNSAMTRQMLGQWLFQLITEPHKPIGSPIRNEEPMEDQFKIEEYHNKLASNFFEEED